jgi:hypothetical protein
MNDLVKFYFPIIKFNQSNFSQLWQSCEEKALQNGQPCETFSKEIGAGI